MMRIQSTPHAVPHDSRVQCGDDDWVRSGPQRTIVDWFVLSR